MMEELLKKLIAPKPTSNMSGFQFSDLFDNNRWETRKKAMEDVAPKRQGDDVYYRQYMPRKDVTEKETIGDDGRRTKTIVSKFIDPGETYGFPLNDRQFRPDDGMGANSSYSPPSLPYERLADINKSRFTPGRFMPSTFAEEGPAMASYAPPTMRGTYDEEGPALGYRGPVMTGGNPFGYPQHATIKGPPRYTDVNQEMRGATPMMPIDRRTSEQTFAYNMVPQADVGLIPITTQSTPQPPRVPLSYSNQSQLNRFPEGISPVGGMTDAMKRRMLELFLSGDGMKLMRSD